MERILKISSTTQLLVCLILLQGCNGTGVDSNKAETKTPYRFRPFSFAYFNNTDDMVNVRSVRVLSQDTRGGGMWPGGGGATISYSRKDCTPDALVESPARFTWWKVSDPSKRGGSYSPEDPADERNASVSFPEFDVEATAWRCLYTLLDDKTWVGKFAGTLAKRPGAVAKPVPSDGDSWFHCHFRNLTGKKVLLSKWETKVMTEGHEFEPEIRFLPADKRFHGFSAHSQKGSIYRIKPGDSLQIAWAFYEWELNTRSMKTQTFVFPEFSAEEKNWYCYFSLDDEKGEWTAAFEGVSKDDETAKVKPAIR